MDLAKVAEAKHFHFPLGRPELVDKQVNEFLQKGWVIVTVKLLEERRALKQDDGKWYPYTDGSLCYILGRPRNVPSDAERKARQREEESDRPHPGDPDGL